MYTLKRDLSFEAGHRLAKGYVGKCSNMHGHSWHFNIVVACETLDEHGFVIDFGILKHILKEVEERFDHKMILYSGDAHIINFCRENKYDFVIVHDNPTSELLSKIIFEMAQKRIELMKSEGIIKNDVKVTAVKIKETSDSTCIYTEK